MYTNKKRKLFHSILDLKMGFPIAIKLKDMSYALVCSSENASDEILFLMNKLSKSSLSIIINKERMKYISENNCDEDLYSISFSKPITSELCYQIACSKKNDSVLMLENAIISSEKRSEILKVIEVIKADHVIPSIVIGSVDNLVIEKNNTIFQLNEISIIDHSKFISTFSKNDDLKIISRTDLPILLCKQTEIISFKSKDGKKEFFALILKNADSQNIPMVRIHSQCITGDLLDSLKCDCGSQLKSSIKIMSSNGGIILYMPEEGRNIGFLNKIRAYEYQFHGLDTIDANHALGFHSDQRDYFYASKMLQLLGIKNINILTNNPDKKLGFEKEGIKIEMSTQLKVPVSKEAEDYMKTKKIRSGHNL